LCKALVNGANGLLKEVECLIFTSSHVCEKVKIEIRTKLKKNISLYMFLFLKHKDIHKKSFLK